MQTKQQIERLLASAGISPNKRLGQHFLVDLNLMRLLISTADIRRDDIILEVGCGTGSLTEGLAGFAGKVIAVEYDEKLAQIATRQLKDAWNVKIINADILETKSALCGEVITAVQEARLEFDGRVMLVANLPYNVGSVVMANLITGPIIADSMYVTIQKEVAERLVASPGSKSYGTLSVLTEAAGVAKIFRKLKPSVFWPRPQVESAMVSFGRQEDKVERIGNLALFREVVNLFIGHRRKMLKACVKLAEGDLARVRNWGDIFAGAFVDAGSRPEELSADNYIAITNLCAQQIG